MDLIAAAFISVGNENCGPVYHMLVGVRET